MKSNRIIWTFMSRLVLITLAVSSGGSLPSSGQERVIKKELSATARPVPPDNRDLSKYGSVQYDSPVSTATNEQRWFANQRYEGMGWVFSSVTNPRAAGVGRITHDPVAPPLPISDSSLILSGEVVSIKTYLSNDRRGVYTEFTIKPDEVLQDTEKLGRKEIRADREGGVVVYPNGQRILYHSSTLALPELNGKYLFFLAKKGESPNFEILSSYDIGGPKIYRLEQIAEGVGKPEESDKARFLEVIRSKIAEGRSVQ